MSQRYKLYSAGVASANGVNSIPIVKPGRIKCIYFSMENTGGAGVGRWYTEVSKQNLVQDTVNNAPETLLASCVMKLDNGVSNVENKVVPCDIPVNVGETIYINERLTGTAPASKIANVYIMVA